jgi:hypothetical protein
MMCLRKILMVVLLSTLGIVIYVSNSWSLPDCSASPPFNDCYGIYTWESGNKYEGEWKNNKRHGKGTLYFKDGDIYVGEYKDGKRNGQGVYTWKEDGSKYVGEYKDGKRNGQGVYTWKEDGSKYVGEYKDGKRNGQGIIYFANGQIQEGIFKDNKFMYAQKIKKIENNYAKVFKPNILAKELDTIKREAKSESERQNKLYKNELCSPKNAKNVNEAKRLNWSNCLGIIEYTKGTYKGFKYKGYFKNGQIHGQGRTKLHSGDIHVGENKYGKKNGYGVYTFANGIKYIGEFKDDKFDGLGAYTFANGNKYIGEYKANKRDGQGILTYKNGYVQEGIWKNGRFQYAKKISNSNKLIAKTTKPKVDYDELYASKREIEKERNKRIELERRLASLLAKQKEERDLIDADIRVPILEIISNNTKGKRGTIRGLAKDNVKVAEVTIDGKEVNISSNGNFEYSTYVPPSGVKLKIEVTDLAGLTTSKIVELRGNLELASPTISFDRLNPLSKRVKSNPNALALIVGVSKYENTNAKAMYADNDALVFKDYAIEKLGIRPGKIKVLLNNKADEKEILLSIKEWLRRSAKPNQSDIYVFFAGHGLASDDGKNMYLLPYDGEPRLLEKTAILRNEMFSDIKEAKPKSVTIFLDTCYSGVTRNEEMLIAGRPIAIKVKEQAIPDSFTLFSAASNEQISRPLEEAKHGMFSYFLMKGMEGDADANNDNKITARELHAYVEQNVVQQSSGSQTPELQGDKDRVLVQFN